MRDEIDLKCFDFVEDERNSGCCVSVSCLVEISSSHAADDSAITTRSLLRCQRRGTLADADASATAAAGDGDAGKSCSRMYW